MWLGRCDDAIEEASRALELEPDNPEFHTRLADCYLMKSLEAYHIQWNQTEAKRYQRLAAEELGIAAANGDVEDIKDAALTYAQIRCTTGPSSWARIFNWVGDLASATRLTRLQLDHLKSYKWDRQQVKGTVREMQQVLDGLAGLSALPSPPRLALPVPSYDGGRDMQ
jgi:hypothetical protein